MDDPAGPVLKRETLCVIHPGGDGAHPWVAALLSALARRSDLHRLDVGLRTEQLQAISRTYRHPDRFMATVMAERSREAGKLRHANSDVELAKHPPDARRIQVYTNDCIGASHLDGLLTDTLLATVASMASVLDGYEWDEHLLNDALERELATLIAVPRFWVASHWQRAWCARYMPANVAEKITVVGWGPGLSVDDAGAQAETREPKTILFIGHDGQRKGLDILLDAFPRVRERHPDAQLWTVGNCSDRGAVQPGVVHHGRLNQGIDAERRKLVSLFHRAGVAVLPSRFEPFGCFLLEAMSARLPIVAPKAFAFPEFLKHKETGLFVDGSATDLAAALDWLFANPRAAEDMGRAGQTLQAAEFDWSVVADRIIQDLARPC